MAIPLNQVKDIYYNTTETCPMCGSDMILRHRKSDNAPFWGCSQFPKCRGIRSHSGNGNNGNSNNSQPVQPVQKKEFKPSPYQEKIFDFVKNGKGNAVICAVAGSGKTTTIVEALNYTDPNASVAFVAFNKHIAKELAKRAPSHVQVSTLHSLGYKNIRAMFPNVQLDEYKINKIMDRILENAPSLQYLDAVKQNSNIVIRLVSLLQSTLMEAKDSDLEWLEDRYGIAVNGEAPYIHDAVKRIFEIAVEDTNTISFDDMIYFCAIGIVPCQKFDFLFVDETQDLNPAQIQMVLKSIKENGRVVAVGDKFQCVTADTFINTPYGNIQAKDIEVGDLVYSGFGGGKIDTSRITEIAKTYIHEASTVTITTASGRKLTSTPEHIYFAGYLLESREWYFVYLMEKEDLGFRIGKTSFVRVSNHEKNLGFRIRLNQERSDKIWILGTYKSEAEARFWEHYYSIKYGIPTWVFFSNGRKGLIYDNALIHKMYEMIDTRSAAKRLLKDLNMFEQYPHHSPKCMTINRRRNFSITLCADYRSTNAKHHYAISGTDERDAEILKSLGLNVRKSKKSRGWRIESVNISLEAIYKVLHTVTSTMDIHIIEKARLGNKALPFTPASHVRPGMKLFVLDDKNFKVIEDEVSTVENGSYSGHVYDFNLNKNHSFSANGIFTHNSIYGFRAADVDAIPNLIQALEATVLPLSITYRCPKSIVAHINKQFPEIVFQASENAIDGLIGNISSSKMLYDAQPGDLVLCRTNAPLVEPCFTLIREGRKAVIRGRDIGKGLQSLITKVSKKYHITGLTELVYYMNMYSASEIEKLLASNKGNRAATLKDQVETIEALSDGCNSIGELNSRIDTVFSDDVEGVVFSSIHKAKGDEANRVYVIKPELSPHPMAQQPWELQQEFNLIYVRDTRAKQNLFFVR